MTSVSRHDPWSWLRSPWTALVLVIGFMLLDGALSPAAGRA